MNINYLHQSHKVLTRKNQKIKIMDNFYLNSLNKVHLLAI
jgi:hypothetical protein